MNKPNVTTVREHFNGYGPTFRKKKGFSYFHPSPSGLIKQEIVKEYVERKGRGSEGSGKSPDAAEGHDSKSDGKKGGEKGTGADS